MSGKKRYHDERRLASLRLTVRRHECIALYATKHGLKASEVLAQAIEEWWQQQPDRIKYEQLAEVPV
jgi:hypothetical protein